MLIRRAIPIIIEDDEDLRTTLRNYCTITNMISPFGWNGGKQLSALQLHYKVFKGLPRILNSQMLCTAIRIVSGLYVAAKKQNRKLRRPINFKRVRAIFAIGPRGRDAAFRKDGKLSIWTVSGRKRIGFRLPEYSKKLFKNAIGFDSLNITEHKGKMVCSIIVKLEVPDPVSINPVGIDLNEKNAVVASNSVGRVFIKTGKGPRSKNFRTYRVMRRLEQKRDSRKAVGLSTRSIDRTLKRLGKKLKNRNLNFARDVAKKLCAWSGKKAVLVFEQLNTSGFKKHITKKYLRRRIDSWPSGIVRRAITSKAEMLGIGIASVSSRYTSKLCSRCGLLGIRKSEKFNCPHCGFKEHADINAAVNIRNRYTASRSSGVLSATPEACVSGNPEFTDADSILCFY